MFAFIQTRPSGSRSSGSFRVFCWVPCSDSGPGDVLVASCHVLAAPPPCGDPVLRLSTTWRPPIHAELDDDIERLDGDDDEFD